jgi:hypothetical protein
MTTVSALDIRECHHVQAATIEAPAVTAARPAMIQWALLFAARAGAVPVPTPPSDIHFIWLAKSLAFCQRSSGAFSRHFLMVRSNAEGVKGRKEVMGGGSFSKIEEATLN